jgi:hypothetical protein
MAKVSADKWSAEDFLILLEVVSEHVAEQGEEYYFEGIAGWGGAFSAMLKKRGHDLGPLPKGWEKLREPVRSGACLALACHGALPVEALPGDLIKTAARRVVRVWSTDYLSYFPGLEGFWPREVWGRALIEAALEDSPLEEQPHSWSLFPHWGLAEVAEQVRLLSRLHFDSGPKMLELCLGLGLEGKPLLEAEARRLLADPDYVAGFHERLSWGACLGVVLSKMYRDLGEESPLWLDELWAPQLNSSYDLEVPIRLELTRLPLERRLVALKPLGEKLADNPADYFGSHDARWSYVGLLQTVEAAQDVVDLVLGLKPGSDGGEETIVQALREMGEVALPALLRPFPGCKAPRRWILYRVLGAFQRPEVAQILVAGAGEASSLCSTVAQEALGGWAWEPLVGALRAALASKRKGERIGAAQVLVARPVSEEARALAAEFAKTEKDTEAKGLLERVLQAQAAQPAQAPASPLQARREALDPAWLEGFLARMREAYKLAVQTKPLDELFDEYAEEEEEESGAGDEGPSSGTGEEGDAQGEEEVDPLQAAKAEIDENWPDHVADSLKAWVEQEAGDPVEVALAVYEWIKLNEERDDFDWKRPWRAALRKASEAPEFAHLVCFVPEFTNEWNKNDVVGTMLPLVTDAARKQEVASMLLGRLSQERASLWPSVVDWLRPLRQAEVLGWVARGLGSPERYEAEWALEQLTKAEEGDRAEDALPYMWPLLRDPQATMRRKVAEVLERLASPASVEPIKEALAQEGNAKAKQALRAALGACAPLEVVLEGATAQTDAELDAALGALPEAQDKPPGFVPALSKLPALRWRSGAALSEAARCWFVVCAARETSRRHNRKLYEVRKRLDDASCWEVAAALGKRGADARAGHLFLMAALAEEAWIEEAGGDLDTLAREGQSAWAFLKLEALRRRASPVALFWIDFYAASAKTPGLLTRADEALTALTIEQGVLQSELLRRAQPPRCGFDARGQRGFGQGAGALTLSLSRGAVALTDAKGKKVAPGTAKKRPDGQTLSALLTAVERASQGALGWCERAMVTSQRWSVETWRGLLEGHPILGSAASGLLWRAWDEAGAPRACFLWDDARSALALDGAPLAWDGVAAVDLPHPLLLGDEDKARAQALLAKRKLVQPFEQLARATHRPQEGGPTSLALPEAKVIKTPKKLIQEAQALGYLDGTVDEGYHHEFWRPLAGRWAIQVKHSGISVESRYRAPQVELEAFVVLDAEGEPRALDALPPLIFSEVMRDFVRLVP